MTAIDASKLTMPKALKLLREVVKEKGADHVYKAPGDDTSQCSYVHHSRPGCLVGQVHYRAGIPVRELKRMDAHNGGTTIQGCVHDGVVVMKRDTMSVLQAAQSVQDARNTWGAALKAAEEHAAYIKKIAAATHA